MIFKRRSPKLDDGDSLRLEAETHDQAGRFEQAVAAYDRLLSASPADSEIQYKRANVLHKMGQWTLALAGYNLAIRYNTDFARAYCNKGVTLERLERWDDALSSYDRAIELDETDARAHYNRASILRLQNRLPEAVASYQRSIVLNPSFAEAYVNCANVLHAQARYQEAVASYDLALELKPNLAEAHQGRGLTLRRLGRAEAALSSHEQALRCNNNYTEAYTSRGDILQLLNRHEEAVESYRRALAAGGLVIEALEGMAFSLFNLGRIGDAITTYDRALALEPKRRYLLGMRRYMQMHVCDWRGFDEDLDRIARELEDGELVTRPFPLLSISDSPRLHHLAAEKYARLEYPADEALGKIAIRSSRKERIRVGYFSADFRMHPVAQVLVQVLEHHDHSSFEITGFCFGPRVNDPMTARLRKAFDGMIDLHDCSDSQAAQRARDLGIDIAVNLGGYTLYERTGIFAARAAPIQVSFLGYPGTIGAEYIDYLIADKVVVPEENANHYTERIAYLPDTYLPADSTRQIGSKVFTRSELRLPASGFVFCCFNNNYKITPSTFLSWMKILSRVDGSVLWLAHNNPTAVESLRLEAKRHSVDPDRIVIATRLDSPSDYLARLRMADLFLDTLPYNAHATAVDALWAGLPILTQTGESFAGRVATSLLGTLDLPELVTTGAGEYENRAVALASDPNQMGALRRRLHDRLASAALFNPERFALNLEDAYREMMQRHQAGVAPQTFAIEPKQLRD